jgi:hypothetical protein
MNKPFDPSNQDLIIGEGVSFTGTIAAPCPKDIRLAGG